MKPHRPSISSTSPPVAAHQKPNVQNGMAAWCLDAIVANQDLMESRRRIKKNRKDGQSMSNKLKNIKRMTAATIFLCGTTRLGEDIKDSVQRSFLNHVEKQAESQRSAEVAHRKSIEAYDAVMALNLCPHFLECSPTQSHFETSQDKGRWRYVWIKCRSPC